MKTERGIGDKFINNDGIECVVMGCEDHIYLSSYCAVCICARIGCGSKKSIEGACFRHREDGGKVYFIRSKETNEEKRERLEELSI